MEDSWILRFEASYLRANGSPASVVPAGDGVHYIIIDALFDNDADEYYTKEALIRATDRLEQRPAALIAM